MFFIVLLLYQTVLHNTVSSRFVWLDTKVSSKPQTMDDLFSDILNDMKLDISFDEPDLSSSNNNIFSIPNTPNTNNFQSYQTPYKPLFLMIDSHINTPQKQNSLFTLQQTSKVNGNTWRYTITTGGNNRIITESWTTPKMYLCNSQHACGSQSGIEMIDILNNFKQTNGQKYMHLVPKTTMQSMDMNMMGNDMEMNDNNNGNTLMNYAMNMVNGCHGKMRNWYYGNENDNDIVMDEKVNDEIIIIDDSELLNEESAEKYKNDDILAIGMAIIMVVIIVCGILYAAWKYMIDTKDRKRDTMNDYVAMKETDQF